MLHRLVHDVGRWTRQAERINAVRGESVAVLAQEEQAEEEEEELNHGDDDDGHKKGGRVQRRSENESDGGLNIGSIVLDG